MSLLWIIHPMMTLERWSELSLQTRFKSCKGLYQMPKTNQKVCRHKIGIIRVCSNNMLSNAQSTSVSEAVVTQITNWCILAELCRQAPEWMERRTNCQLDKQHASQTIKRITAGVDKLAHSTQTDSPILLPFERVSVIKLKRNLPTCMKGI